jgi:phosphoserine phosphatase
MRSVVTLVADPALPRLSPALAEDCVAALAGAGFGPGAPDWLAPNLACDIGLDSPLGPGVRTLLHQVLGTRAVDVVVQAAAARKKRLLVSDMESTVIENEMVDELAELVGVGERVAAITRRAMNGEIGFKRALAERVALLGGLEAEALEQAAERIRPMAGARALVSTMRRHGAFTALVSGGFSVFTARVARRLGFDREFANTLVVEGGVVTGRLVEPIFGREAKREIMDSLCVELGLGRDAVLAVGDGANDTDMIQHAGMGVAFRAKPVLAAAATHRIDHGDLTALLYIQGYRQSEIVEG